jgi:hypothetical protein
MEREKKIYGGFIASKSPSSLPSHHILVQCYVFRPIMFTGPVSTVDRENKLSQNANSFFVVCFLGFTITLYEFEATIKTLWKAVKGMLILILPLFISLLCHPHCHALNPYTCPYD